MHVSVNLFSNYTSELNKFLSKYYNSNFNLNNNLNWKKEYINPIEVAEIIGVFTDNYEDFSISMWICLDKNTYINITPKNGDTIIRYLFERFPY